MVQPNFWLTIRLMICTLWFKSKTGMATSALRMFWFMSIFEQIVLTATGTREDYGVSECVEPDSASFREQVFPFV